MGKEIEIWPGMKKTRVSTFSRLTVWFKTKSKNKENMETICKIVGGDTCYREDKSREGKMYEVGSKILDRIIRGGPMELMPLE